MTGHVCTNLRGYPHKNHDADWWTEPVEEFRHGYLYAFEHSGFVKIGFSLNPAQRIGVIMRSANLAPFFTRSGDSKRVSLAELGEASIWGQISASLKVELRLHKRFNRHNIRQREWYPVESSAVRFFEKIPWEPLGIYRPYVQTHQEKTLASLKKVD